MDTITILGISLLFFYSLTTMLQFYGIDTSVYSIYILFYIFIIVSRLILPMNYAKLFPDAPVNTDAPVAESLSVNTDAPINPEVHVNADTSFVNPSVSPDTSFAPVRPASLVGTYAPTSVPIRRTAIGTYTPTRQSPVVGTYTPTRQAPVIGTYDAPSPAPVIGTYDAPSPAPSPAPSTTSDATPPKKPKNQPPSGPTNFSGLAQGFGALFSALSALA